VDLRHALHGGDDYELLFTARRGKRLPNRIAGVPVTLIGHVRPGKSLFLAGGDGQRCELRPQGWQHFKP
jgi:thiamine-monophosphate kinase